VTEIQRQELPNNTIEQVKLYVTDALTLTETIDPPDDLRAAVFTAAVNLISGKQIVMQQPQPFVPPPFQAIKRGYS
jgi:hypothetical protein